MLAKTIHRLNKIKVAMFLTFEHKTHELKSGNFRRYLEKETALKRKVTGNCSNTLKD